MKNKLWTKSYEGFESIMDFDEEWIEALKEITPHGEYMGTVKIIMEYIPSEEEENDSSE